MVGILNGRNSGVSIITMLKSVALLAIILSTFFLSCSRALVDDIERGATYNYKPGYPELLFVSSGYVDEYDNTKLNVVAEIIYGSLIYRKVGDLFQANVSLDLEILNKDNSSEESKSFQFPLEITNESPKIVNDQSAFLFDKEFDMTPGDYLIKLTVTDLSSRMVSVRTSESYVPNLESDESNITNIRLFAKWDERNGFSPITTYDISNKADSVKFLFQVTNNDPEKPITIVSTLKLFESDTTVARPMNFQNYRQGGLPYRGIEFGRFEEISRTRRALTDPGSVLIELIFTDLERGNYRLEVVSEETDEREKIFKARDFGIKSEHYPSLKTAEELAAPLVYIMTEKEYSEIMKISNPDKLKMEIDRFWLKNIKDSKKAREVISLYYQRVEQANKQFSTYKEGWKTDLGMIYILFGPPWYSIKILDRVEWSYTYNTSDPEKNFIFYSSRVQNKFFPFQNYLLSRDSRLYNTQYQQVQQWRSGGILRDNL